MSLICPRCEKPMNEHDDDGSCLKQLSRRFFMGGLGTLFAGAMAAKALPKFDVRGVKDHMVVLVAPKVVRVPGITITTHNSESDMGRVHAECDSLATRKRQSVTLINRGVVEYYVDPVKDLLL